MKSKDRTKVILDLINKKYGIGTISKGSGNLLKINRLSSGIFTFDLACGGGIPQSSIIEFSGREQSAKTTTALKIIAEVQAKDLICAYIDVEHTLNPEWATKLGVDMNKLLIAQPDTAEKAIDIVDSLVRSKAIDLVVYDSLAAALPSEEEEKSAFDQQMGLLPRLYSKMCRKLASALQPDNIEDISTYNNTTIILINQIREQIGTYHTPTIAPGGHALRHAARVRVEFKAADYIEQGTGELKERIGRVIKFRVIKNKTYKPYVSGQFDLYFDGTIDNDTSLINESVKQGIITRAGSYYMYKNTKIQGKDNLIQYLKDSSLIESLAEEIKKVVLKENVEDIHEEVPNDQKKESTNDN